MSDDIKRIAESCRSVSIPGGKVQGTADRLPPPQNPKINPQEGGK